MSTTRKSKRQCQHKDCIKTNVVPCYLPSYTGPVDYNHADTWLCPEHCQQEGFCWGCGQFWAGIESFDFSPTGLCDNCKDEDSAVMDEIDADSNADYEWNYDDGFLSALTP